MLSVSVRVGMIGLALSWALGWALLKVTAGDSSSSDEKGGRSQDIFTEPAAGQAGRMD
jgi:hypothetical protein